MGNMVMPATTGATGDYQDDPDGECWQFKLGQCISHKDRPMPSLVLSRFRTSHGDEVYGVRSFAIVDPNRDRMIMGASLTDVIPGSEPCLDCLLFSTVSCPGLRR